MLTQRMEDFNTQSAETDSIIEELSDNEEEEECPYCPQPCKYCGELCFSGKCYGCFPERILPCKECGEKMWDGECNCLENEENEE